MLGREGELEPLRVKTQVRLCLFRYVGRVKTACQLAIGGDPPSNVVLLDSYPSGYTSQEIEIGPVLLQLAQEISLQNGRPLLGNWREWHSVGNLPANDILRRLRDVGVIVSDDDSTIWLETATRTQRQMKNLSAYSPSKYAGRVTLVRAADPVPGQASAPVSDDALGWRDVACDLTVITASGDHYSMLNAPHVAQLAEILRPVAKGPSGVLASSV